jgi:hypothetical protein
MNVRRVRPLSSLGSHRAQTLGKIVCGDLATGTVQDQELRAVVYPDQGPIPILASFRYFFPNQLRQDWTAKAERWMRWMGSRKDPVLNSLPGR